MAGGARASFQTLHNSGAGLTPTFPGTILDAKISNYATALGIDISGIRCGLRLNWHVGPRK